MRMSRERVFHLADLIVKELSGLDAVSVKAPDELRPEVIRVLSDEARLEDTIDAEVRKTLSTYSRPALIVSMILEKANTFEFIAVVLLKYCV